MLRHCLNLIKRDSFPFHLKHSNSCGFVIKKSIQQAIIFAYQIQGRDDKGYEKAGGMRANRVVRGRKSTERPRSDAVIQTKLAPKLFTFLVPM